MANLNSLGQGNTNWRDFVAELQSYASQYVPGLSQNLNLDSSSATDQEAARDILSLLPPPTVQPMLFSFIASDFENNFTIDRSGDPSLASKTFGDVESAVVLSGLSSWGQNLALQDQLSTEDVKSKATNPLEIALERYIKTGSDSPNTLDSLSNFKDAPLSTALMRTANPALLISAFEIAQQRLVIDMLDKWIEAEAERADQARRDDRIRREKKPSPLQEIISGYVDEVKKGTVDLSQPAISLLIVSLTSATLAVTSTQQVGSIGLVTTNMIDDSIQAAVIPPMPQDMRDVLSLMAQGMVSISQVWALPVTFAFLKGKERTEKEVDQASARAYTATLISFLNSETFSKFISSRIDFLTQKYGLTEAQGRVIDATVRIALIVSSLALLYRMEVGALSGAELKLLMTVDQNTPEGKKLYDLLTPYMKLAIDTLYVELSKLPEEARNKLIDILCMYYDKSPDVKTMMDPTKAFLALWKPDTRATSSEALEQKG